MWILLVCAFVCRHLMPRCSAEAEVKGELVGVTPVLLLCGSQILNLGHPAQLQMPLPAEPPQQPPWGHLAVSPSHSALLICSKMRVSICNILLLLLAILYLCYCKWNKCIYNVLLLSCLFLKFQRYIFKREKIVLHGKSVFSHRWRFPCLTWMTLLAALLLALHQKFRIQPYRIFVAHFL